MGDLSQCRQQRQDEATISRLEHVAHIGLTGLETLKSGIDTVLQQGDSETTRQLLQHLAGDVRRTIGLMNIEYENVIQNTTHVEDWAM